MGKRRKPTQAISFEDCLQQIGLELFKLQKSTSRFRDFAYMWCARYCNQNTEKNRDRIIRDICGFADLFVLWADYLRTAIQLFEKVQEPIPKENDHGQA